MQYNILQCMYTCIYRTCLLCGNENLQTGYNINIVENVIYLPFDVDGGAGVVVVVVMSTVNKRNTLCKTQYLYLLKHF